MNRCTDSALSKSLQRLEQELQTLLCNRAARPLTLNADGKRLAVRAGALMTQAEQVQSEWRATRIPLPQIRPAGRARCHAKARKPCLHRATGWQPFIKRIGTAGNG